MLVQVAEQQALEQTVTAARLTEEAERGLELAYAASAEGLASQTQHAIQTAEQESEERRQQRSALQQELRSLRNTASRQARELRAAKEEAQNAEQEARKTEQKRARGAECARNEERRRWAAREAQLQQTVREAARSGNLRNLHSRFKTGSVHLTLLVVM